MRRFLSVAAAMIALAVHPAVVTAQQADLTVPGGATGANVSCLQAGELASGAFAATFLETAPKAWEERLKTDTFKLEERDRDDLMVELFDPKRQTAIRFDFVNRTVKYKSEARGESKPDDKAGSTAGDAKGADGDDRYYILNATDKAGSKDCAALAERFAVAAKDAAAKDAAAKDAAAKDAAAKDGGAGDAAAGDTTGRGASRGRDGGSGAGAAGGGSGVGGPGMAGGFGGGGPGAVGAPPPNPMVVVVIPPRTPLNIAPGTNFTAIRGPQCPGHPPGWFICPNQFTCAPPGGVCCPGLGACANGSFCDQFVPASCIGPGDPRFCGASANANTGIGLHCAPGETCVNNLCY